MENFSGQVIKSYEVHEKIGSGGFGEVYRAIQASVGREVAIKIILPEYANHPEFIRRFETEAQLVARLEHPHIVPLYDYWREPSGAFLVMRFLRGGSLRDSIEQNDGWSAPRVAQMVNQIAAALTFAHQNGVIHRDLKSDNILIDQSGNSYLTDFGIAKNLQGRDNITQDAILGTPAYLSPEQIRGEAASPQSDIYALGIVAFEALTGVKPFVDTTPASILFKQLNEPLPDLAYFRSDLTSDLNLVLQRATSKDPKLRYDTAIALARDFTTIIRETEAGMPAVPSSTIDIISITSEEEALFEPKNPYKGLRAFQQADVDDFFGRDALIQQLLQQLALDGNNEQFLAVVGPSGSGKSSVVKAGLLPRIQSGALGSNTSWYTIEMVPGTYPMEELEAALLGIASTEMPALIDQLREDKRGLARAVKRIIPENAQLVLFIDQFEEVFTLVQDEDRRTHFLDTLVNTVEDERSRIKIIITMRADFYDRPLLYSGFGNLIRQYTELVLPLTDAELRETILRPADRMGMTLEPALLNAIVNDVYQQPGALPLLQYALTELFERRDKRKLTYAAYQEIGGTSGALARRADELYRSFSPTEQATTRQMFLRLVNLGDGTEDTRRRVFQGELISLQSDNRAMRKVIDIFGRYRLLTFDNDPQTRSSTVEVAHEALIRQWAQVRKWLDENRDSLRMHRRLSNLAEEWNQARRESSFLARGARLQQLEEWSRTTDIELNATEKAFLEVSIHARNELEQQEREQQEREEKLRQQARNRLTILAVAMTIAAVIFAVTAGFAITAQQSAEEQAILAQDNAATATVAQGIALIEANNAATSAAVAAENAAETRSLALAANARNAYANADPQLAMGLVLTAGEVYQPVPLEVLRTMASIIYAPGPRFRLVGHTASIQTVAFSPDNHYAISSSVDGTVRIWDVTTGEQVQQASAPDGVWFNDAILHPFAGIFAAVASDGLVYVWNWSDGSLRDQLEGHTGEILSITISPDGQFLLTGGTDHTIRLWNVSTGALIRTYEGHTGVVFKVAFSPDGSRFVSSSGDESARDDRFDLVDRTIRIWDTVTGENLITINPASGFVRGLDFSPLGDTVAAGMWDGTNSGTVRIYDVATGTEVKRFFAHTTAGIALAYSPDGRSIVSSSWDRVVRIWDIAKGVEIDSFTGFNERILGIDYSADGQYILLGLGNIGNNEFTGRDLSVDSSVYLWDTRSRDQVNIYRGHTDWLWALDINNSGTLAATGSGPLRLPEQTLGQELIQVDTSVLVWDIDTLETIAELRGHSNTVNSVRFHPNQAWILSAGKDGLIILWEINTESRINLYRRHDGEVFTVRFSADGNQFISAGADGLVILWDTASGRVIQTFEHPAGVVDVNFSPDETLIATTSGNQVYLWDVETGAMLLEMTGHTSSTNEVAFHPSGEFLVSSSWDSTLRVWDVAFGEEQRQFAGHTGHTFGIDFSADGELMLSTSQDKTVRMWDFFSGEELHRFEEHTDWVQEVHITRNGTMAISAGQDNVARIWRIDRTVEDLTAFAQDTRYIRELTCGELGQYRIAQCE